MLPFSIHTGGYAMKRRFSMMLILFTCACSKVGSNEWAQLHYPGIKCKGGGMVISNGC